MIGRILPLIATIYGAPIGSYEKKIALSVAIMIVSYCLKELTISVFLLD